jgi:phosphoenolpyruvate carboxykinase (ATP)
MMQIDGNPSEFGLDQHNLDHLKAAYWNSSPARLVEQAILREEASLAASGAVVVSTGKFTGRSPGDKYLVHHADRESRETRWCKTAQSLSPEAFDRLYRKMAAYLQGREVFVQDMQAGAHPRHAVPIRIITDKAWASLFSHNLFIRMSAQAHHHPKLTVLHCPDFYADPAADGTRTGTLIALDFRRGIVLIGGTAYAGEIKKSVFTALNYRYPRQGILPMHCAANVGAEGDVALFFGLSGTGKTTLSSDPERRLIGDDEHGWSDEGVFNFEGGCYAKTIRLRADLEPLIWAATRRFGTVLENVEMDPATREVDFDSDRLTENTRAAYPIDALPGCVESGYAGHPRHIFFLTADATGVLPPLARLTPEQALYYFLSGYTSKVAGTERGLGTEPQATFSTCFAAPFLPLDASVYADLLGEKIARHQPGVWLVNTGWTGGPYGVGERIRLPYTRAMIHAVLSGALEDAPLRRDERFGLWVPEHCPGVPDAVLAPETAWADRLEYERRAGELVRRFEANFAQYTDVRPEIVASGPGMVMA